MSVVKNSVLKYQVGLEQKYEFETNQCTPEPVEQDPLISDPAGPVCGFTPLKKRNPQQGLGELTSTEQHTATAIEVYRQFRKWWTTTPQTEEAGAFRLWGEFMLLGGANFC